MGGLLLLTHRGIPCALPAPQAVLLTADIGDVAKLELWPPASGTPPDPRFLHVATGRGPRVLQCGELSLLPEADAARHVLPPLLVRLLGLPHVVELIETGGALRYLVDLARLGEES